MSRRNKTKKAAIDTAKKKAKCVELRQKGLTYRRIAIVLGISKTHACYLVTQSLMEINRERAASHAELVDHEWAITDQLMDTYLPLALDGDLDAFKNVMALLNRRARYRGLDAPTKVDSHISGTITSGHAPALTREQMRLAIEAKLEEMQRITLSPTGDDDHDSPK